MTAPHRDEKNPLTDANAAESSAAPDGIERRKDSDRRASVVDRRSGLDRRDTHDFKRRRGPGIRRSEDRRSAEEGEMSAEQFEFVMAIQEYKKVNNKTFPTWTEVLEVITELGYRKVESADDA